jgi:hypothetical protein
MERIAALSTGTKLMIASGALLFLDLFSTWQNVPQRFGKKFDVTASLDGWDRLGLVLGLVTLGFLVVVVLRETDVELSPDVPWNRITLALAAVTFGLALLKNVTDAHSAWGAYVGVVLAALAVVGAYLERDRPEPEPKAIETGTWRPRERATGGPTPTNGSQSRTGAQEPETRSAEPARRW